MTNTAKIVTSLAVGTEIGATLGLLFAPHKGKRNRAILAEKSKEAADAIGTTYHKAKEMVGMDGNHKKYEMAS
jgi:gas vesicle protein